MGTESSSYRSDYTNAQLYELVRQAAVKFGQPRPHKMSTRKFDAARSLLGHPKAPSGRWIAKRLGHQWPEVVQIALDANRDVTMTDSAARRSPAEKWLDDRHLYFALNFVAQKRGVRSFSSDDYELMRAEVIGAAQRGGNATLPTILPTPGQIIQIVRRIETAETAKASADAAAADDTATPQEKPKKRKSRAKAPKKTRGLLPEREEDETPPTEEQTLGWWNKALVLAGLEPFEPDKATGISIVEAIHYYIEATGFLPAGESELRRFARQADISYSNLFKHPDYVAGSGLSSLFPAVAALRQERGLPMADELSPRGGAGTYDLSKLPSGLPRSAPSKGRWANDPEGVLDALCAYLDSVSARNVRQPTQTDYRQQQKLHRRDWPAAATLGRVGEKSFDRWIERAQKEWARRKQGDEKAA